MDFFFAILCFFFVFFCYTLPCFFVNFGGLSLPCHLLCCYLFIYLFFLHGFSVDFFLFVSLIALGTSSLRLIVFLLGGWLHRAAVSRTGIEG